MDYDTVFLAHLGELAKLGYWTEEILDKLVGFARGELAEADLVLDEARLFEHVIDGFTAKFFHDTVPDPDDTP